MPIKLPGDFYEFICKNHELQLNKHIGSSKSDWDANLRVPFSRWNQKNELIKKESKKFTACDKNMDQTLNAAKNVTNADSVHLCLYVKKSLIINNLKSIDKNKPQRQSNQQVPKPKKTIKLNESFM